MAEAELRGLTAAEATERRAQGRVNRVRRSDAADYLDIVRRNVLTVFNGLVAPAAVALFALREYRGGIAVSGMATINTLLGLIQEIRAKRHLDRLTLLAESRVRVLRDGEVVELPAGDVVQDDVVLLSGGEPVVADGPVLESRYLEVDEALLTGESDPVRRRVGDPLLSGSFAVAGEGAYRAERVGLDSFAQRTTVEARAYHFTSSPLQRSIDRVIFVLTALAVFLSAFYLLIFFTRPYPATELFQRIAATITSMVPQGLVLMTTLAYLLGAVRMSQRGAVVQRLSAVESMASVNVLCMDKTGTLTTNRLELAEVVPMGDTTAETARRQLAAFAAASLDQGSKAIAALRDGLPAVAVERLDQLPFKSQNRYSAVRVRVGGDDEWVLALGAKEALAPLLDADQAAGLDAEWRERLATGQRILVLLRATEGPAEFDGKLDGFAWRPAALVALRDELRPEARAVLEGLADQGIAFKILSGDNAETVQATVRPLAAESHAPALRALAESPVVSGAELASAADPAELIHQRSVFGRIEPRQKVAVVKTLQDEGRFVAMIGDGVNDVLPIKHAHLGIAMGDGSRATKTVAGLVLETNDFGLLPQTLEEGRTIVRNLRRSAKLFLVKNAYTIVLIVGALGVLGLPFPFLPQQVTLLNLLTIGIPAFIITLSKEKSAAASRPGFLREVGSFVLRTGLVTGLAGLAAMSMARWIWPRPDYLSTVSQFAGSGVLALEPALFIAFQRTLLLTTLVLLGLTTLLRALSDGEEHALRGDRRFRWLAAGAVPVYLLAMYWPLSAWYHVLIPLRWVEWAAVLAVVAVAYLALWAWERKG